MVLPFLSPVAQHANRTDIIGVACGNENCEICTGHITVKKGQTVVYKKWTNQEVQHKGKEYLLVKFDELLGVVE